MAAPLILADGQIPAIEAALEGLGEVVRYAREVRELPPALRRRAQALVVRTVTPVDAALLEAMPALRVVATASAGIDHLDLQALHARGVAWSSAAGCNATAVADHVVTWVAALVAEDPGLRGRPVGVVGFGHTGRRVTRHFEALGLSVRVCDPPLARQRASGTVPSVGDAALDARAREVRLEALDELIAGCGVVSLHVPLDVGGADPTHHLINARRIAAGPVWINAARGGVLDEAAALAQGRPCLLDVFEGEPRLRPGLLDASGPVRRCSPHIAGYSLEAKLRAARLVAEGVAGHLDGVARWHEADALPPPPPVLEHRSEASSVEALVAELLAALHPLRELEAALRAMHRATVDDPDGAARDRAANFATLRRAYPLRREFGARRVSVAAPALSPKDLDQAIGRLGALGVSVARSPA